ncbi:MAG: hypothetical protein OEY89_11385 [Gammaproteobacteria bacterium]|nr:hypothetical protein [Gammaproteobacteria bacterium]
MELNSKTDERKLYSSIKPSIALALILLSGVMHPCIAEDNYFRNEFINNYKSFDFRSQEKLLKENGGIIPGEVRRLIEDAMKDEVTLGQRMYLLDAANAMASGYVYYHNDGEELIKEIEKLIQHELDKEKERNDELTKWNKDEMFLGNFVMKENIIEMEKQGLPPVIYPHWIHRIWYECRVCHDEMFPMQRWHKEITHKKIEEGKLCGACHNGKIAFGADKKCDNCHLAGKPESARLQNVNKLDHENIKQVANRIGAEWNIENLPDKHMPVDKYGFIDWLVLQKEEVIKPVHSLDKEFEFDVRDNNVLFVSKSKLKDVVFNHKIHSTWIECSSCHPQVFREDLNNDVKMVRMSKGKYCGRCHGKVSFTFSDCLRCHNQVKGQEFKGALLHVGKDHDVVKPQR